MSVGAAATGAIGRVASRWLFRPASPTALGLTRLASAGYGAWYLIQRRHLIRRTAAGDSANFDPVGIARPLRRPLPTELIDATTVAAIVATGCAAAGAGYRVTGPFAAALTWVSLTYRNSWSMVYHSDNLLVLHLTVLGLAPAADAVSVDRVVAALAGRPAQVASWEYGWPLRTMEALTVSVYVLAGLAKLKGPLGWRWGSGEHLRAQIAADGIRKSVLKPHLARENDRWLALPERHRQLYSVMGYTAHALELAAPVALTSRRAGRVWSIAVWAMHVGIRRLMGIVFRHQLSGVAYAPFHFDRMVPAPCP